MKALIWEGAIFTEILPIRLAAGLSPWSIRIFLYVMCDYKSSTQKHVVPYCVYNIVPYWHAPNKLITSINPYVAYSFKKNIMSVYTFFFEGMLIIIFIRKKNLANSHALFCAQIIYNAT